MNFRKLLPYYLAIFCAAAPLSAQTTTPPKAEQTNTPVAPSTRNLQNSPEESPALRILEEQNVKEQKTDDTNSRFFMEFVQMLITLGFILVLILLAGWFLRRLLNTRLQQANTTSAIKVLERRSLTPKSALYLIEVAGKKIVIAETHAGITRLTDFPTDTSTAIEEKPSFDKVLKDKMKNE